MTDQPAILPSLFAVSYPCFRVRRGDESSKLAEYAGFARRNSLFCPGEAAGLPASFRLFARGRSPNCPGQKFGIPAKGVVLAHWLSLFLIRAASAPLVAASSESVLFFILSLFHQIEVEMLGLLTICIPALTHFPCRTTIPEINLLHVPSLGPNESYLHPVFGFISDIK